MYFPIQIIEHCEWATWGSWAQCTHTCGGGKTFRSRIMSKQTKNGGRSCSGDCFEFKDCNHSPCPFTEICKLFGIYQQQGK